MRVERLSDARELLERASPLLLADEPRHNLIYGIADVLVHHPGMYPSWDLWLVSDADRVVGAALQTPPYNLVLGRPASDEVLDALVGGIAAAGVRPPGVSAVRPEAEAFAERWTARMGGTWRARMAQGVYALTHVREVPETPGSPRVATPDDEDAVSALIESFADEAVLDVVRDPESSRRTVATRLGAPPARGGFWLWELDSDIVSISGHGGPTPNGIRIGPVYTPPVHRGRGYATALVAAQSAWLLAHGRTFCFLYTDLGNPTSNGIYRRIGYVQVGEAADIAFAPSTD
jgi:predicted GNAT family acetyltransferase